MLVDEGQSLDDFDAFCAAAHPQLVRALAHHFGDRYLAEELAQEALVRAGEKWARVRTLASPVGWAFRVGCNLGTSVMRRRGAERRALRRRERVAQQRIHHDPDTPDRLAVTEALDVLTDAERRAVVARHFLGLTPSEAAEALGTSAGSVRVLTHRGLAKLREALDEAHDYEGARRA